MACDHRWIPFFATILEQDRSENTFFTGYSCAICDLSVEPCPVGRHPFGFPYDGRVCDWCCKDKPDRPPQ
jgi:hypothetical protein